MDGFVRRTLQLEGITSLKLAVERAKAVKIIQGENFERRKDFEKRFEKGKDKGAQNNEKDGKDGKKKKEMRIITDGEIGKRLTQRSVGIAEKRDISDPIVQRIRETQPSCSQREEINCRG